eukprot:366528-Chlamydomonas_euryale.AAC.9
MSPALPALHAATPACVGNLKLHVHPAPACQSPSALSSRRVSPRAARAACSHTPACVRDPKLLVCRLRLSLEVIERKACTCKAGIGRGVTRAH